MKNALITGAGTRLGQAMAIHLSHLGYNVVVHYHTSASGAEFTAKEIKKIGREAFPFQANLIELAQVRALSQFTAERFPALDILINNASTFPDSTKVVAEHSFTVETEDEWDNAIAVNTKAPFFLIQALANNLTASKDGVVLNILDSSVTKPILSRAAHTISKSALCTITTLAAKSFAGKFRVNALELGAILPPSDYEEAGRRSRNWAGVETVLSGLEFVINTPFLSGEIIRLDGGEGLG